MRNATYAKTDYNYTLEAANYYQCLQFSVIPVLQGESRKPLVEWKDREKAADQHQISKWFANRSDLNVAIMTGQRSQIVVLDVDYPEALAKYGEIPKTPTVKTDRGHQYYFRWTGGPVGKFNIDGLGDFLGDGCLATAPPSLHYKSGEAYTWVVDLDVPMADVPQWLLKRINAKVPKVEAANDNHSLYGKNRNYGLKALRDEYQKLRNSGRGGRNIDLNDVGCKLGNHVAAGNLSLEEVTSAMVDACDKNGLLDDGEDAAWDTIESGLECGLQTPRYPLPAKDAVPVYSGGKLNLMRASDIQAEKINWLWRGVMALGHITLISGDPGTGKSQLSLNLAAIVSNGGTWPVTGERCEPGNVIILSREDRAEDTIIPRLMAAGADCDNVYIVGDVGDDEQSREFRLKEDMPKLKEVCEALGNVSLIIIDPISSHMQDGDINNAGDVRSITNELAGLAQQHMASVLMITHNSKGGASAGTKVTGSHAWLASARTAFSVTKGDGDDAETRTMAPIKSNISKDNEAYQFQVVERVLPGDIHTSFVEWQDQSFKRTADEVLAEKADGPMMAMVKEWLEDIVPIASGELWIRAKERGFAPRTVNRAKGELRIVSKKDVATGRMMWVKGEGADHSPSPDSYRPRFG